MKDKKEIRLTTKELRAIDNTDNKMIVEGYAITFDEPATHGFTEIICRGALDGCDMKDVVFRYNHKDGFLILARTRNRSLILKIDDIGLFIRAELIDTQSNIDVYKSIQAGLLDKMSFAFTVSDEEWDYERDIRKIKRIETLYDVAVVDTPFYDTSSIYARALNLLESGKGKLESLKVQRDLRKRKLKLKTKIGE